MAADAAADAQAVPAVADIAAVMRMFCMALRRREI